MQHIKKYKVLIAIALVALAGCLLFLYRMYDRDAQALAGFAASYENFDRAISGFSVSKTNDAEAEAIAAGAGLNAAAAFRLSSLTKNDALISPVAHEIADMAGKELSVLDSYQSAIKNKHSDASRLAREYGDLADQRKAAYARFQELAGMR